MKKQTKKVVTPVAKAPVAPVVAPVAKAPRAGSRLRLPLADARKHNVQFVPLAKGDKPVAATVAGTVAGTNPKKARVFGYDNLANGGGVPKDRCVILLASACPKGVAEGQWVALCKAVKASPLATVADLRDGGIAGRTLRRAYRNGAIRFAA